MPRNIITTITITDDADPPGVVITVHGDGAALVEGVALAPQEAVKLVRAVGTATGDRDVEDGLRGMLTPVVERLRESVHEGDVRQARRKDALTAWEAAAAPATPGKP